MNLAILITVSRYTGNLTGLPGCIGDAQAMRTFIDATGKYDEVLAIESDTGSAQVKERLVRFIENHKSQQIDELWFYFSGHGDFDGEDFYYLLTDFDQGSRRQTSIQNSELDRLLRSLNPKLTAKVVDACHSGISYVKNADDFSSYLKNTSGNFKTCYFLFSSHASQESFQDEDMSLFTRSLIQAAYRHLTDTLRYKDMMDFVADEFASHSRQTPLFVVQGDFTEVFSTLSVNFRQRLAEVLGKSPMVPEETESEVQQSLSDLIRSDAERFCTQEEAISILNRLPEMLASAGIHEAIRDLYHAECEDAMDYPGFADMSAVGSWIEEHKGDYFATPLYRTETHTERVPSPLARLAGFSFGSTIPMEEVERTRQIVYGINLTTEVPLKCVLFTLQPRFPNLEKALAIVVPVPSPTQLALFSGKVIFRRVGWNEDRATGETNWSVREMPFTDIDSIRNHLRDVNAGLCQFVVDRLETRFLPGKGADEGNDVAGSSGSPEDTDA